MPTPESTRTQTQKLWGGFPKREKPVGPTSPEQVNEELKGFKSLAEESEPSLEDEGNKQSN